MWGLTRCMGNNRVAPRSEVRGVKPSRQALSRSDCGGEEERAERNRPALSASHSAAAAAAAAASAAAAKAMALLCKLPFSKSSSPSLIPPTPLKASL